jgi:hypothetical protein
MGEREVDDQLEEELAASETSGTWSEPTEAAEDYDETTGPRTPPPESGPQVAPAPPMQLQDLDGVSAVPSHGDTPSMEQLGSTVDLEPATSGALEMAATASLPAPDEASSDEFEEELPAAERAGVYDESLRPPPTVRDDLAAVDRAHREREARLSALPEAALSGAPESMARAEGAQTEAGVLSRTPVPERTVPVTFEGRRRAASHTFLELLDDALGLGN